MFSSFYIILLIGKQFTFGRKVSASGTLPRLIGFSLALDTISSITTLSSSFVGLGSILKFLFEKLEFPTSPLRFFESLLWKNLELGGVDRTEAGCLGIPQVLA